MYQTSSRQRTVAALASFGIVGLGGAALVIGLSAQAPIVRVVQDTLVSLTPAPVERPRPKPVTMPQPKPTVQAKKAQTSRPKDAASPANLRNQATAVFAPVLPPLRSRPPIVAAPRPAVGNAANTGASDHPGPGQGAGGIGNGIGGGGNGDGDGDGYADAVTRPIQIRGKLHWHDLPRELRQTHRGGDLELVYRVNIDGRVSGCRVTQSSGIPALDAQTCRLITERFRFRPSEDANGRPVPSNIIEHHGWDPAPGDVDDLGDD